MATSDEQDRVKKANPHYIIAGALCVVGFFLIISLAGAFIGAPMLLIGLLWFAIARWAKSHDFANR